MAPTLWCVLDFFTPQKVGVAPLVTRALSGYKADAPFQREKERVDLSVADDAAVDVPVLRLTPSDLLPPPPLRPESREYISMFRSSSI